MCAHALTPFAMAPQMILQANSSGKKNRKTTFSFYTSYILDSHMAPYGACEVAQSTARSKAQFEAERFRKGFRRKNKHDRMCFEGKRSMLESASEGKRSMLEQCFRALSGLKARSSSDFECSVASKEKEACSSSDFERSVAFRRYKKQARAVISSAQRPKRKLEQ